MKKLLLLTITLFQFSAFASNCPNGEAQIIAKITSVQTDSMHYCVAYISEESISHYSSNIFSLLDKQEVIQKGIDFPLVNGHDCEITKGETLSGYLCAGKYKITLEN